MKFIVTRKGIMQAIITVDRVSLPINPNYDGEVVMRTYLLGLMSLTARILSMRSNKFLIRSHNG